MIRLDRITKQYRSKNSKTPISVLHDISCTIERGEMIALMGRSGSGKTTLINILSGLLQESGGRYQFDQSEISQLAMKDRDAFRERHIGMIVQEYALMGSWSGKDNILLPVRYRKQYTEAVNKRMKRLSHQLGITHCLNKKITELSGGECQRVAIVRALIKEPDLILADEPTGSLDSASELIVMNVLKHLQQMGNTIVIATHSDLVASYCDRVFRIEEGRIQGRLT